MSKIKNLYLQKGIQGKQTPSQWKREKQISLLKNTLMDLESKSYITCREPYCISHQKLLGNPRFRSDKRTTDLDMVRIPWYERWVCLDCYNDYYKEMILYDFIASKGESLVIHDKGGMIERNFLRKYNDSFIQK